LDVKEIVEMNVLERICESGVEVDLFDIEFVAFDTETTGLSPLAARLVELSGVKFKLGTTAVTTFSSLINPECGIPPEVTNVHGITDEMVADAPRAADVIPRFIEWIGSHETVLVAHNAPFDVGFLQIAMTKLGLEMPGNVVVDTLPLARRLLKDAPNHRLQTLVEYFQLEADGYHRALADSHHVKNILAKVACAEFNLTSWSALKALGCTFAFNRDAESENGWFDPDPEVVRQAQIIRDAIAVGAAISFVYQGARKQKRKVTPTAVLQNRGNFYLTANCHRVKEERTFRVDKMFEVELLQVVASSGV